MLDYRCKLDGFRRSGKNYDFCQATRIRFHGDLDAVLKAVQAYEFPYDPCELNCHEYGHVTYDGELIHFAVRDYDTEDEMRMHISLDTRKYEPKEGT